MPRVERIAEHFPELDLRLIAGVGLMLLGGWVALGGLGFWPSAELSFDRVQVLGAGDGGLARLAGHYPVQAMERYEIRRGEAAALSLESVSYRDRSGVTRRAILHPEASAGKIPGASQRRGLWLAAAKTISEHTDERALFLSWWDNAQRIDFLTGRKTWASGPAATAFANRGERLLWDRVAGPSEPDDRRLRQLARWLAMDAQEALADMAKELPGDAPIYLLACVDDLARVAEIERLSGTRLGFEAAYFPGSGDLHGQIAQVRRWAGEKGAGSYLVQSAPGGIRAWRITDAATENSLFAKLLPFTGSLAQPAAGLSTVYQSSWGSYLTVFELSLPAGR